MHQSQNKDTYVKRVGFSNKLPAYKFIEEAKIATLMGDNNIGPKVYDYRTYKGYGEMTMEKLDGNLIELWPYIGQTRITDRVTKLIKKMHDLDLAHGDLHARNIGYRQRGDVIEVYIIDFGNVYTISTGESDPEVVAWMLHGFDWEQSYADFVDYDFINWQQMLSDIPLPEPVLTNVDQNTLEQYYNSDCGVLAMALSEKLGWPVYRVSENLNEPPAHYIVRAPGGEYFADVSGLRPKQYFEGYWQKYFGTDRVYIGPVDECLSNPDYYESIVDRINNDDVKDLAFTIYDSIMERYYFDYN